MTQPKSEVLTFAEKRLIWWLVLSIGMGVGVWLVVQGMIVVAIGQLLLCTCIILLLGPGTVVTFDSLRALVVIEYRGFLHSPDLIEIPFDTIATAAIDEYRDSEAGTRYGLVLIRRTGEHIELPASWSSDQLWCEQQAQRINALLGVEGPLISVFEASIRRRVWEGNTGGIAWQLERLSTNKAPDATHWFSAATPLPGQFIALYQAVGGTSRWTESDKNAPITRADFITGYLRPLLFDSSNLPGLDHISYVAALERRLSAHFITLSSSPEAARAWLTPPVSDVLVTWATQHPVQNEETSSFPPFKSLLILVSPEGLRVMCQSALRDPALIEELVALGVGLVQARQGTI